MMFNAGSGPPLIVVPGLQGRWEWYRSALDRLAAACRVTSYSLAGDLGSGWQRNPSLGFENYVRQLDAVVTAMPQRPAVCGISYGGFVALRYAAMHPGRISCLILVSAPAPGWSPNSLQQIYLRRPWLNTPRFIAGAPLRLWPEIRAAHKTPAGAIAFILRYGLRTATHPMIPGLMATRISEQQRLDFTRDAAAISVPTLIVTGEPQLDRVVPVESTRKYAQMISGAKYAIIQRTGHLGLVTRPDAFARVVCEFVHAHADHH